MSSPLCPFHRLHRDIIIHSKKVLFFRPSGWFLSFTITELPITNCYLFLPCRTIATQFILKLLISLVIIAKKNSLSLLNHVIILVKIFSRVREPGYYLYSSSFELGKLSAEIKRTNWLYDSCFGFNQSQSSINYYY